MHKLLLSLLFIPCIVHGVKTSAQHPIHKLTGTHHGTNLTIYLLQKNDNTELQAEKIGNRHFAAMSRRVSVEERVVEKKIEKTYHSGCAKIVFKRLERKYNSQNK